MTELLEGETLRQRIQSRPVPARRATDYALQIVRGLVAAHGKSVLHRDLKPENIFLTSDGRIENDFGVAKLRRPEGDFASVDAPTVASQIGAGVVLGAERSHTYRPSRFAASLRTPALISSVWARFSTRWSQASGHSAVTLPPMR